jgi:hypothetical protein
MIGETCSTGTDSLLILIINKLVIFLQFFKMPFPHRISTSNGNDDGHNVPVLVSPLSQVGRGMKDLIMEPVVVK